MFLFSFLLTMKPSSNGYFLLSITRTFPDSTLSITRISPTKTTMTIIISFATITLTVFIHETILQLNFYLGNLHKYDIHSQDENIVYISLSLYGIYNEREGEQDNNDLRHRHDNKHHFSWNHSLILSILSLGWYLGQ